MSINGNFSPPLTEEDTKSTPPSLTQEIPQIVSTFPPPPLFYTLYESNVSTPEGQVELQTLIGGSPPPPPPIPIEGTYNMFGRMYTTEDFLPSLESEGRIQLYSKERIDHIAELKRLMRLLLSKFLALLDSLVNQPEQQGQKIEEIELIFINLHHLINSFRPHQARQTLISQLEDQISKRKEFISSIDQILEETERTKQACQEILISKAGQEMDSLL